MNYDADEYAHLVRKVEEQGGTQLPDPCSGTTFRLKQPGVAGVERVDVHTTGCANFCVFAVPYDPEPGSKDNVAFVTACAVDDNMGLWPRFRRKR